MKRMVSAGLIVAACFVALLWAAPSVAQPPVQGPAPVHRPVYGPHPGGPHFSAGFYYGPYFGPYFYNPWFYAGFWGYPPYGYGYPYYWGAVGANIKVQVQPKSAEVYVDGHLAGIVDQFDGMFQNLVVDPGSHEITVYLEGYKSIVQKMYLSVGSSYKIKGAMEKLAAGEPNEPRPVAAPLPAPPAVQYQALPQAAQAPYQAPPAYRAARCRRCAADCGREVRPGRHPCAGRLTPRSPLTGSRGRARRGAERLVVHLSAGTHRVEIRKEGFDSFVTAVEIRRGEVTVLNVSLRQVLGVACLSSYCRSPRR